MLRRLLTLTAFLLSAGPVMAQSALEAATCGTREDVTRKLESKYGEFQKGAGLVSDNRVLELWQSTETGSWTILMTRPDGTTCIMTAGAHWRDQPGVEGDPA